MLEMISNNDTKFEKLETSEESPKARKSAWVKDTADDLGTKQDINLVHLGFWFLTDK